MTKKLKRRPKSSKSRKHRRNPAAGYSSLEHILFSSIFQIAAAFIPGFDEFLRQAAAQYPPSGTGTTKIEWRSVLGFSETEKVTRGLVQHRFRELAMKYHPDKGGSHDYFVKIVAAYREGLLQTEP